MLNLSPEEREIVRRIAFRIIIDKLPYIDEVHENLRDRWFSDFEALWNAYEEEQ